MFLPCTLLSSFNSTLTTSPSTVHPSNVCKYSTSSASEAKWNHFLAREVERRWWVEAMARETTWVRMRVVKRGCSERKLLRRTCFGVQIASGQVSFQTLSKNPVRSLRGAEGGARESGKGTKEEERTDGSLLLAIENRPELAKAARSEEGRELAEEGKDKGELRVVLVVVVRNGDRELFVVHVQRRSQGF